MIGCVSFSRGRLTWLTYKYAHIFTRIICGVFRTCRVVWGTNAPDGFYVKRTHPDSFGEINLQSKSLMNVTLSHILGQHWHLCNWRPKFQQELNMSQRLCWIVNTSQSLNDNSCCNIVMYLTAQVRARLETNQENSVFLHRRGKEMFDGRQCVLSTV